MRKILIFLILLASTGFSQTVRDVIVDNAGKIVAPANLWEVNADEIVHGINQSEAAIHRDKVAGPYAVIRIDLPAGSGVWTDFELKISSVNFDSTKSPEMLFFYHSPDPEKSLSQGQVWTSRPDVYYTDSGRTGNPNRRMWLKQGNQSITASLHDVNSVVGGFIVIVRDDLRAYRDHLVISYCLMDGANYEEDPAGRSIWRTAWVSEWVETFDPNP